MKKTFTKILSVVSTATMLTATASILPVSSASAASIPALNLAAEGDYYVPSSLVAAGNIAVRIKVYFEPADKNIKYDSAHISFVSDYDSNIPNDEVYGDPVRRRNIVFGNISDPTKKANTSVITYDGTTFETNYSDMFCFGQLDKSGGNSYTYSVGGGDDSVTNNCYAVPTAENIGSVTPIKYDGNGGFYFTITQRKSPDSAPEQTTYSTASGNLVMYRLETDEVRFKFNYIDQRSYNEKEAVVQYKYLKEKNKEELTDNKADNIILKDKILSGDSDEWDWKNPGGSSYLGEKDEFSLCEVDAVIKQGTKKGVYTISLDPEKTYLKGNNTEFSLKKGNLTSNKATIHIVDDVKVASADINEKLYYNSDDKGRVTTKDVVNSVKIDVTENGVTKNVDITKAVGGVNVSLSGSFLKDSDYTKNKVALVYSGYNLFDENEDMLITEIDIGLRGDANLDGKVDSKDAVAILKFYAQNLVSGDAKLSSDPMTEDLAYFLADANGFSRDHGASGSAVDSKDAVMVLRYYAKKLVDSNSTWDGLD